MKKAVLGASLIALMALSFTASAFNGKPKSSAQDYCNETCCVDGKCDTTKCKGGKCDGKCKEACKDKKSCSTPAAGKGCCAPKSNQPK